MGVAANHSTGATPTSTSTPQPDADPDPDPDPEPEPEPEPERLSGKRLEGREKSYGVEGECEGGMGEGTGERPAYLRFTALAFSSLLLVGGYYVSHSDDL